MLAAITLAVFGQTLRHEFVNYDDSVYVFKNPAVTGGLSLKGVEWAFTHTVLFNWHPLTVMSHMLDCQLYGLHAGGHHLTNVLLHTASVILLFLVLRRMTGFLWRSALVAAVFAIHPLRVESVAWVAERKDVLSGLFFMLTLWAYTRYAQRVTGDRCQVTRTDSARSRFTHHVSLFYGLVLLFFALGLMSKPMLVTLPFVLLLLDYWPLNRFAPPTQGGSLKNHSVPWRLLLEKIPLLVLSGAICVVTMVTQKEIIEPVPVALRMGNAVVSYVIYLRQMIWPAGLAVLYPYPRNGLPGWEIALAVVLLAAISAVVIFQRRRQPYLLVGWLWYLGMLVPVIGLVQVGGQANADRYTYLPQIGLYFALTWAVGSLGAGWRHRRLVLGGLSAVILVALIFSARIQTSYWLNGESLWAHTIACTSDNDVAHNNLGNALLNNKKVDEAITQYQTALQIKPDFAEALNNLGNALMQKERTDEAIAYFQKALEIKPGYAEAHGNLGNAFLQKGQVDEAIAHLQKAIEIQPGYAEAHYNLGNALLQKGRTDEANVHLRKAVEIEPQYSTAQVNLGIALFQKGRVDEAIAQFQSALELQIQPDDSLIHYDLAIALLQKGRVDEAIAHYKKAVKVHPEYANAPNNLGNALLQKGQVDEAIAQFQNASLLQPGNATACYNLGNALLQKGRVDEAIAQFQKALEIKPDYAEACNNLGSALMQKGRTDEAIARYQKALAINPGYAEACNNLGNALLQTGRANEAIAQFQKAVALRPDYAKARNNLGRALLEKGRLEEAVTQFQEALKVRPDYAEAGNNLARVAWLLATSPEASVRNGARAVALAGQVEQLSGGRDAVINMTLAAAYAEAGRYAEALETARRAEELAAAQNKSSLAEAIKMQIERYQAGTPFRDPSLSVTPAPLAPH